MLLYWHMSSFTERKRGVFLSCHQALVGWGYLGMLLEHLYCKSVVAPGQWQGQGVQTGTASGVEITKQH